jgi:hypothetical protein
MKQKMNSLIQGEEITEVVKEGIIFPGVEKISDASWSVLLYAGYVTTAGHTGKKGKGEFKLKIPNEEIRMGFMEAIEKAFYKIIPSEQMMAFLDALTEGREKDVSRILQEFVLTYASMYDFTKNEPEKSYHLFVLGMLVAFGDEYEIRSNRESDGGRYDIMMAPKAGL